MRLLKIWKIPIEYIFRGKLTRKPFLLYLFSDFFSRYSSTSSVAWASVKWNMYTDCSIKIRCRWTEENGMNEGKLANVIWVRFKNTQINWLPMKVLWFVIFRVFSCNKKNKTLNVEEENDSTRIETCCNANTLRHILDGFNWLKIQFSHRPIELDGPKWKNVAKATWKGNNIMLSYQRDGEVNKNEENRSNTVTESIGRVEKVTFTVGVTRVRWCLRVCMWMSMG